jgi:hypothetical protein
MNQLIPNNKGVTNEDRIKELGLSLEEIQNKASENGISTLSDLELSYLKEQNNLTTDIELLNFYKELKLIYFGKVCQEQILGYFKATVNGVEYDFSFDREAQQNFTGTLALFTEGLITEMEWTAWLNGQAERIILDKPTFLSIINVAFAHKNSKISHLRNDIQPLIEQATTIAEVEAISW